MSYTYRYPRPAVTADSVVLAWEAGKLSVLLVERKHPPYRGCWAFPGGFMEMEETAGECAVRELQEETGVVAPFVRQIGAFSAVGRDPRGRVVTVAFYTLLTGGKAVASAGDDAAAAAWYGLDELPALAFDHAEILEAAVERLQEALRGGAGLPGCTPRQAADVQEWLVKHWK